MKTIRDVLSILFDEHFVKKAQGYSELFESWKDIAEKNRIAAAADHCRIKDLDRGILLVETDHPGWKQLLQTKQSKLLNDFRIRFPEQNISGISFMLGKNESFNGMQTEEESTTAVQVPQIQSEIVYNSPAGLDAIKDENFKESLKKLGQSIAERDKNSM